MVPKDRQFQGLSYLDHCNADFSCQLWVTGAEGGGTSTSPAELLKVSTAQHVLNRILSSLF